MKYYHIIRKRKRRMLGMTIAADARETSKGMLVTCGVAYCAPLENNFSRPLGRKIALHRMNFQDADHPTRVVPFYKHLEFSTPNIDGLKIKILKELVEVLPIKWARGLVNREIDLMTNVWKERQRQGLKVKKVGKKPPRRLVAKKKIHKRPRSKVDTHPKKQEIIVMLKRGDSARSVARWTWVTPATFRDPPNGPAISESTMIRFRRNLS